MYRHIWLALASLLSSAALTACATYEGAIGVPASVLESEFVNAGRAVVSQGVDDGPWWQKFGDAELNGFVEEALVHNSTIQEAMANVNAARSLHGLARWEYAPTGGAYLSRERQRVALVDGDPSRIHESVRGGFSAIGEIDLFGRIRSINRLAEANVLTTESAFDLARLLVVAEVTATYHSARATESRIEILSEALQRQQYISDLSRALVEEGRAPTDVLDRALAELAVDEVALLSATEQLRTQENRLAVLLGRQAGRLRLPGTISTQPLHFEPIPVGDIESLLRRHPDIRMAEHALLGRQAEIGITRADYFPRLTLSGFFGFAAGSLSDLDLGSSESWSVAPALTWNVLDFGRTTRRLQASESRVAAAAAAYERVVLEAIEDAENAMRHYETVHRELALRATGRQHALDAAAAAQARYEEGADGYLAALLARRDALLAELASVDSVAEHRLATVAVFTAIGAVP